MLTHMAATSPETITVATAPSPAKAITAMRRVLLAAEARRLCTKQSYPAQPAAKAPSPGVNACSSKANSSSPRRLLFPSSNAPCTSLACRLRTQHTYLPCLLCHPCHQLHSISSVPHPCRDTHRGTCSPMVTIYSPMETIILA